MEYPSLLVERDPSRGQQPDAPKAESVPSRCAGGFESTSMISCSGKLKLQNEMDSAFDCVRVAALDGERSEIGAKMARTEVLAYGRAGFL